MKDKINISPKGGWQDQTYYVVKVKFNTHNVEHAAILSVGFMTGENKDLFGGYCYLFNNTYDPEVQNPEYVYSIKYVRKINMDIKD